MFFIAQKETKISLSVQKTISKAKRQASSTWEPKAGGL